MKKHWKSIKNSNVWLKMFYNYSLMRFHPLENNICKLRICFGVHVLLFCRVQMSFSVHVVSYICKSKQRTALRVVWRLVECFETGCSAWRRLIQYNPMLQWNDEMMQKEVVKRQAWQARTNRKKKLNWHTGKKCGNSSKMLSRYDDISFSSFASHFRHQWQNEFGKKLKLNACRT